MRLAPFSVLAFLCWHPFCAHVARRADAGGRCGHFSGIHGQMGMPWPKRPAEGQGGAKMGVPCALWGDGACRWWAMRLTAGEAGRQKAAVGTERPLWANGRAWTIGAATGAGNGQTWGLHVPGGVMRPTAGQVQMGGRVQEASSPGGESACMVSIKRENGEKRPGNAKVYQGNFTTFAVPKCNSSRPRRL